MNLQNFFEAIIQNGGASYSITSGELNPTSGYFVSTAKNELVVAFSDFGKDTIADFISANGFDLSLENRFLGGWVNNNQVFLDVSDHISSRKYALQIGMERNQLAIHDANVGKDIHLPSVQKSGTMTQQKSYVDQVVRKLMTTNTYY